MTTDNTNTSPQTTPGEIVEVVEGEFTSTELLTKEEARQITKTIQSSLNSCAKALLLMDERQGYQALGYSSWKEWVKAEIEPTTGYKERYLYFLKSTAEVERNLMLYASQDNELAAIMKRLPASQIGLLAKLPPEKQPKALKQAEKLAKSQGKKRSAETVKRVVARLETSDSNAEAEIPETWRSTEAEVEFSFPKEGKEIKVVFLPAQSEDDFFHRFQFRAAGILPTPPKTYYAYFDEAHQLSSPLEYAERLVDELFKEANSADAASGLTDDEVSENEVLAGGEDNEQQHSTLSLSNCQSEAELAQYLQFKSHAEIWQELQQQEQKLRESLQTEMARQLVEFKTRYRESWQAETQRQIAEKDERIAQLEQQIEVLQSQSPKSTSSSRSRNATSSASKPKKSKSF